MSVDKYIVTRRHVIEQGPPEDTRGQTVQVHSATFAPPDGKMTEIPRLSLPLTSFTRAEWEEIKALGDAVWEKFERAFGHELDDDGNALPWTEAGDEPTTASTLAAIAKRTPARRSAWDQFEVGPVDPNAPIGRVEYRSNAPAGPGLRPLPGSGVGAPTIADALPPASSTEGADHE